MVWISASILIAQIAIAAVTYFTVHHHRAIYDIKTAVLRMPHETPSDACAAVLQTDHIDKDLEIILGQIKK